MNKTSWWTHSQFQIVRCMLSTNCHYHLQQPHEKLQFFSPFFRRLKLGRFHNLSKFTQLGDSASKHCSPFYLTEGRSPTCTLSINSTSFHYFILPPMVWKARTHAGLALTCPMVCRPWVSVALCSPCLSTCLDSHGSCRLCVGRGMTNSSGQISVLTIEGPFYCFFSYFILTIYIPSTSLPSFPYNCGEEINFKM